MWRTGARNRVAFGSAAEADVSAQLTNKAGATLFQVPTTQMAGSLPMYQVDVPLASLARGEYLIAVAAAHGEERTRALVPVRVLPF